MQTKFFLVFFFCVARERPGSWSGRSNYLRGFLYKFGGFKIKAKEDENFLGKPPVGN